MFININSIMKKKMKEKKEKIKYVNNIKEKNIDHNEITIVWIGVNVSIERF